LFGLQKEFKHNEGTKNTQPIMKFTEN